jgi:hypothetical protein
MTTPSISSTVRDRYPQTPDTEEQDFLTRHPRHLLGWIWARLALGEPLGMGAKLFERALAEHRSTQPRAVWELVNRGSFAAISELLGQPADSHLEAASRQLEPATREEFNEAEWTTILAMGMALSMLRDDHAALRHWRERRMGREFEERVSPLPFEVLFATGPEASAEAPAVWRLASTRIAFDSLRRPTNEPIAPLLLTTLGRARATGTDLPTALSGTLLRLDEELKSPRMDQPGVLRISAPAFDVVEGDGHPAVRMVVTVAGDRPLCVGAHLLRSLNADLTKELLGFIEATKKSKVRGMKQRVVAALMKQQGNVYAELQLPEAVTLDSAGETSLLSRFTVGWQHASAVIDGLVAPATFRVVKGAGAAG